MQVWPWDKCVLHTSLLIWLKCILANSFLQQDGYLKPWYLQCLLQVLQGVLSYCMNISCKYMPIEQDTDFSGIRFVEQSPHSQKCHSGWKCEYIMKLIYACEWSKHIHQLCVGLTSTSFLVACVNLTPIGWCESLVHNSSHCPVIALRSNFCLHQALMVWPWACQNHWAYKFDVIIPRQWTWSSVYGPMSLHHCTSLSTVC